MECIHENYLENEEKYDDCAKFWERKFLEIAGDLGARDDWVSFGRHEHVLGNGTVWHPVFIAQKFGGLGTILRKIAPEFRKGICITQVDARVWSGSPNYLEAKIDRIPFDTGFTEGDIDFLIARVLLTEASLEKVELCMREWTKRSTTPRGMTQLILRLREDVKRPSS
jgi:hypothetical protein